MLISTVAGAFNGIGGLDLAAEWVTAARPLFHAEPDPYCAAVLRRHWPEVPNYGAIQNIHKDTPRPDLFVAGFPCTDASSAGKRKGLGAREDYADRDHRELRTGLWHYVDDVLGLLGPRFVFLENVEGLLVRGLDTVLGDLASRGYDAEWSTLRAADVGAPHLRRRVFIFAARRGLSDAERLELRELGQRYRKQQAVSWSPESRGDGWRIAADIPNDPIVRTHVPDSSAYTQDWTQHDAGRQRGQANDARPRKPHAQRPDHGDVCDADTWGRGEGPGVPARQPYASGPGAHVADGLHDGREGLSSTHDDDGYHELGHDADRCHPPLRWPGWPPALGDEEGWARYDGARPGVRRSAYGLPRGVDARRRRARLARLGNAVVPQQAALALAELMIRAAQV